MAGISFPYGAIPGPVPPGFGQIEYMARAARIHFMCVRQKKVRSLFEIGFVNLKSGGDLLSRTVFVLIFDSPFRLNRH